MLLEISYQTAHTYTVPYIYIYFILYITNYHHITPIESFFELLKKKKVKEEKDLLSLEGAYKDGPLSSF